MGNKSFIIGRSVSPTTIDMGRLRIDDALAPMLAAQAAPYTPTWGRVDDGAGMRGQFFEIDGLLPTRWDRK